MTSLNARLTYIGGPTALLEWEGLRLLTDPTFDPAGTGYTPPTYTLRKLIDQAAGIYLSGDTVWYEGVQEVSSRFSIRMAVLFMGAARVAAVGDWPLTFTASEGVEAARAFSEAMIAPVHYEGWEHFSESRLEITQAFAAAGLNDRLYWLPAGAPTEVAGT